MNRIDHSRIIVAHPGRQHSYQLANALEKNGVLHSYITTVYDDKKSVAMKIVKKIVGKQSQVRVNSRKSSLLPGERVKRICEWRGLLLLAILRLDKTQKRIFYTTFNNYVSKVFGIKIAKYAIKEKVDAVVCYDTSAFYCFKYLKKNAPSIKRILDNAAANRYGLYEIYQEMDEKYNIFDKQVNTFKDYLLEAEKAEYFKAEAHLADYHIVASDFAARTLERIGIEQKNIFVIPYGVELTQLENRKFSLNEDKLKILFVGEISPQKGIYQFLDAAERLNDIVEFHVVGAGIERLDVDDRKRFDQYVDYHGYLLQKDLFALYTECDVFVFPSLGDGFGFVVLEAMNAGMPVICSLNSIGANGVEDGYNGFLIDAGNSKQLIEKIIYFENNRHRVVEMGKNAQLTAKKFTWNEYNNNIVGAIYKILGGTDVKQ